MRIAVTVALLSALAPGLAGQGKPAIEWATDYGAAFERAKAERRPVMVHFNMDNEPACLNISKQHFHDSEVVALSRKFVCLVASRGSHEAAGGACERFPGVDCAGHVRVESQARMNLLDSDTVTAPQFVFCHPDGRVIFRRVWDLPVRDLLEAMNRALGYFDPSLSDPAIAEKHQKLVADLLVDAACDHAVRRRQALDALAQLDDPTIVAFLVKQTGADVDEVKRNEAIQAIGDRQNPNCLARLHELLRDRSTAIRRNAIVALYKLHLAESVGSLLGFFKKETNGTLKAMALRAVADCGVAEGPVAEEVLRALSSPKDEIRLQAVRCTLALPPTEALVDRLASLALKDAKKPVRAHALYALAMIARADATTSAPASGGLAERVRSRVLPSLEKAAKAEADAEMRRVIVATLLAFSGDLGGLEAAIRRFDVDLMTWSGA